MENMTSDYFEVERAVKGKRNPKNKSIQNRFYAVLLIVNIPFYSIYLRNIIFIFSTTFLDYQKYYAITIKKCIINSLFTMQRKHHNYVHYFIFEPPLIFRNMLFNNTWWKMWHRIFEEQWAVNGGRKVTVYRIAYLAY